MMHSLVTFSLLASVTLASKGPAWKYGNTEGQVYGTKDWSLAYEHCKEDAQSPINIIGKSANLDSGLKTLEVLHPRMKGLVIGTLSNNGHAPTLAVDKSFGTATITGGPLGDREFQLEQFHLHFGCKNIEGSEHTVNGKQYSGELHLVTYNTKYKDFAAAVAQPDGLAVIGVFFQRRNKGNHVLMRLSKLMDTIEAPGASVEVTKEDRIYLTTLVPRLDRAEYYTYPGSLTTPPCYQSVTWIVLKRSIAVSDQELQAMRKLKNPEESSLCNNFRNKQNLNGRLIRKNH